MGTINLYRVSWYFYFLSLFRFDRAPTQDPYDRHHNPTGYIALCVAENKLITNIIVDRCMQTGTASAAFNDPQVYCYNSFLGMPVAREATAYFLRRWFLYPTNSSSHHQQPPDEQQDINPGHIALAVGASAILSNLFFVLGDVGDACLIPAPYYAAFENDMNLVAGIVPFAVHSANPMHGPTESDLSLAFLQCKASGLNPKFLLLTNPNNPLGVIYRSSVIQKCVEWARKREVHTIVDEIYGLSTHQVCLDRGTIFLGCVDSDRELTLSCLVGAFFYSSLPRKPGTNSNRLYKFSTISWGMMYIWYGLYRKILVAAEYGMGCCIHKINYYYWQCNRCQHLHV